MAERMRSLVMTGPRQIEIWDDIEKPEITRSELLIRTKAWSICTVDQRAYRGSTNVSYPLVDGHEVAGVIEAVGEDVRGYQIGDKVVTTFQYCGYCDFCKSGRGTKCLNSRTQKKRLADPRLKRIGNGGMAEFVAIPATQVCHIGDNVPFELAAMTEPLGCCIHSVRKTRAQLGETAVVIGAGIMGILHTKLLRMMGVRVIISEVDPVRREKALALGASLAVNPTEKDPIEYVKQVTDGIGADIVINTTSIPQVWAQAIDMTAPYGRIIAYASQHPAEPMPVSFNDIHGREIEIIGTVSPAAADFVTATKLMKYDLIEMRDVLEKVFPFEQAQDALEYAILPGKYRCVVRF